MYSDNFIFQKYHYGTFECTSLLEMRKSAAPKPFCNLFGKWGESEGYIV